MVDKQISQVKKVSFTKEVKNEIAAKKERNVSESLALLSAFIKINGSLVLRNNEWIIDIHTEDRKTATLIFSLMKNLFQADCKVKVSEKKHFKKPGNNTIINIEISKGVKDILHTLQIYNDKEGFKALPGYEYFKNTKVKQAYLAGAFLASGSVNSPKTSNYHLEISVNSEEHGQLLITQLAKFYIEGKMTNRRNQVIVYLKKSDQIADFLKVVETNQALMKYEDIRIQRDMYNNANRILNCDSANLDKTVKNGLVQQQRIKEIEKRFGIENLALIYRDLALIRLEHPEYSLNDLKDELQDSYGITLSRSGVNHRLQKLMEIYESLVGE